MKVIRLSILLFACVFCVMIKAQENVVYDTRYFKHDVNEAITPTVQHVTRTANHAGGLKDTIANYIYHLHFMVAKARIELKAHNNKRPSTQYSIHDIIFPVTQYLPSWVYPSSLWKEDHVSRRRHIARVLRSTPLIARPHVVGVRDSVIAWTKSASQQLENNYTTATIEKLDSLLQSAEDFVMAATDPELMDSIFLSSGYVALDDAVTSFLKTNKQDFDLVIRSINHEFNDIVSLAGNLRRSLESVRDDAIAQTKLIRDELFASHIDHRLRHLNWHIRTEIQNLAQELRNVEGEDTEASRVVRKHTADSLRTEIETLYDIKMTLERSKTFIHSVWSNAAHELLQSPASIDYWVDVVAEVKEAAMELARSLTKKHQARRRKHCTKCSC
ncbi:uncharacterized protein B0P05DRAFT_584426 [Gilbertella persicaria]|uniref:uncharacterized protein n=1 Tax=Gilbertella persicaria TaxID=101096 RepID=UPI002220097F|nr:uncharacterized protein B0P05DRAFT_584426 [Gilbertella persicaria]KAI8090210.1 hypothetical protein B0P05DRAFT_584426 [Gilbertella persicaria]